MKTVSLKVSEPLEVELTAMARERGMSKSALIREALELYMRLSGHEQPGSALSLVTDLAGALAGPDDLSVNEGYLQEFGR